MNATPEIIDLHVELAIEALDGVSWQTASAARLLCRGDRLKAVEAYRRAVALIKEFASADMQAIAASLEDFGDAA